MNLDLTNEEQIVLVRLVKNVIDKDYFPHAPRLDRLKAMLSKLARPPIREPLPPPKFYAPRKAPQPREGARDGSATISPIGL